MFIRKWRLKLAAGITLISMLPALALALNYSDLIPVIDIPDSPGRVLGESAYNSVTLTSPTNKSLQVVVTPKYFDQTRGKNGEWLYEITWKRTLQRDGSLRAYPRNKTSNKLLAVNTKPAGSEQFYAPPLTSIRVYFYSQTEGRGGLLLGKYFTTLKAEASDLGNLGGGAGMANPASVYCVSNGGKIVMRSGTAGGQSGYCVFPDGQECEEWAYYNGACGPKNTLVCPKSALSICPDGSVPTQVPGTCNYACPTPKPCQPRPACLDVNPSCMMAEPKEGWCKPDVLSVNFGQEFKLKKGQSAQFNGKDVTLTVTGFGGGCSGGVQCFWSGLAVYFEMKAEGRVYAETAMDPYTNAPRIFNLGDYKVHMLGSDSSTYASFKVEASQTGYQCPLAYPYCPNGSTQYTNKDGCVVTVCNPGPEVPAPVIDGISGPTTLNVNQAGTWSVTAHNLNNGSLSYAVDWGEYLYQSPNSSTQSAPAYNTQQTSTFTHAYSQSGKYTAIFTVTNQSGVSNRSSITVIVTASSTQPPATCNYLVAPSCADGSKPVFSDPNSCGYTCPASTGK